MASGNLITQTVFSKNGFHGLPTFPDAAGKKYSAIVAGANGITGSYMVRVLADSPERWETIYALSRKPPNSRISGNVMYLTLDLLSAPDEIARQLEELVAKPRRDHLQYTNEDEGDNSDYVFFAAYIQPPPKEGQGLWSDAEEMERVNVLLLSNFLTGLELSNKVPKCFLLQTGAKHYGVHLGPPLTPMEESDPRFQAEPNFYFRQEDLLWKWAAESGTEWVVTRPGFIIGAVREASMSIAYGLAIYAAVQKELGQSLDFPGDFSAWDAEKHLSSAHLLAYHAEWAILTPAAHNQILNSSDGSLFTYGKFWPVLAALHGLRYQGPEIDETKYGTLEMPTKPPPRGFGPAGKIMVRRLFEDWANTTEVREAWVSLMKRHNLNTDQDPFDNIKSIFGLLDGEMLGPWGRSLSIGKSRKLGWHGYIDTHDFLIRTFEELSELKMIPPFKRPQSIQVEYEGY